MACREQQRAEKGEGRAREREERERRKAEAAAAKRYPMEDLELAAELAEAAAAAGEAAPAPDVALPGWLHPSEAGRLATTMYVSDFLHQFGRNLGLRALTFADFGKVLSGE